MVRQAGAAMKVGTDGALLGAWATVGSHQKNILDIGTGTGLIALMLAQRSEGWSPDVSAIDIDRNACAQAGENFSESPWGDRLSAMDRGLREFAATHIETGGRPFDLIVSNPPYFNGSLLPPDKGRLAARHTETLSHEELVRYSAWLISEAGLLSVILPADAEKDFIDTASSYGFTPVRKTVVYSLPGTPPKRVLLEFSKCRTGGEVSAAETDELTIETSPGGNYSEEYRRLTRDFYLRF